jgi:hypothetical protein
MLGIGVVSGVVGGLLGAVTAVRETVLLLRRRRRSGPDGG